MKIIELSIILTSKLGKTQTIIIAKMMTQVLSCFLKARSGLLMVDYTTTKNLIMIVS